MKKVTLLCIALFVFAVSCKKDEKRVVIEEVKLEKGQTFNDFLKNYTTFKNFENSGVEFVLAKKNNTTNRLLFYTKGLKSDLREVLKYKGNILNVFVGDINNDNHKELYIIFAPLKGETYETVRDADILGYTLTNNKNVARLKVQDIEELTDFNTDKVNLKNNVLSRTYIQNNKEHTYNYELSTKDYTLIPKKAN